MSLGGACPYLYINGIQSGEILRNLMDISSLTTETTNISEKLSVGENQLEIKEEKNEITYFNKFEISVNGNIRTIFENKILKKGDFIHFCIEK
jgi:hypothetical protein